MPPTHDTPRSLADALRSWDDAALAALLRSRPDLAVPLPADLTTLAARAASRSSVQRAVDALSAPELQVVEILAVLPEPATPGQVTAAWGTSAAAVLQRLRDLALVWGSPRRLYLVRAVRDALGPYPAGLGPTLEDTLRRRSPELADRLRDQAALAPLLAQVPDAAREVLDRLTWGPPIGQFAHADREVDAATPGTKRAMGEEFLRFFLFPAQDGQKVLQLQNSVRLSPCHDELQWPACVPVTICLPAETRPASRFSDNAAVFGR